MITVRRARERRHHRRRSHEVWSTFGRRNAAGALAASLGDLDLLDEHRLQPGAAMLCRPQHCVDIITYVREGSLAYPDAKGSVVLQNAGEFQRRTVARGVRQDSRNASSIDVARVFQVWLRLAAEREPGREQKRFSAAERRGLLCVVASPDGRRGSLRLHQDALLHSALLDRGQHVAHELAPGHDAWLHLVDGEIALGDVILTTGDGAGISADRAVSLTAREPAEILLLDLWHPRPRA